VIEASVAIKDGKILSVGAPDAMPPARETVDVSGMHVLPARSTCMCISAIPVIRRRRTSRAAQRPRRSAASRRCSTCRTPSRRSAPRSARRQAQDGAEKAHVDYGLYAVLGEDTIANVPALIETA